MQVVEQKIHYFGKTYSNFTKINIYKELSFSILITRLLCASSLGDGDGRGRGRASGTGASFGGGGVRSFTIFTLFPCCVGADNADGGTKKYIILAKFTATLLK